MPATVPDHTNSYDYRASCCNIDSKQQYSDLSWAKHQLISRWCEHVYLVSFGDIELGQWRDGNGQSFRIDCVHGERCRCKRLYSNNICNHHAANSVDADRHPCKFYLRQCERFNQPDGKRWHSSLHIRLVE